MIVKMPFGASELSVDMRGLRCRPLGPSAPRGGAVRDLVQQALGRPLHGPALAELARGRRAAVILVPDATRRAYLPEILPLLLAEIGAGGVLPQRTTVLVACGSHPGAAGDTLRALVGALPAGVALVQHDARGRLAAAGTLSTGLHVRLNPLLLEADLVVAVSTVQHHYLAGFGGGPKMVFPGVAGYDEIQTNHARVLDLAAEPPRRHPGCEPGVLDGNPIAAEIMEAAKLRPPDQALLLVAGSDGRPAWAAAGPLEPVYAAACERVRAWFEVEAGPFSKMLVSGGGHPVDETLIQAHKALDAACRFAAPGAEVMFAAACSDGAGSAAMNPFLADPRPEAIIARLRERYVQYGQTTLRLLEKTGRFRVRLFSELDGALAARLGFEPADDVQAVLDRWREDSPGAEVGLMIGPAVYPRGV